MLPLTSSQPRVIGLVNPLTLEIRTKCKYKKKKHLAPQSYRNEPFQINKITKKPTTQSILAPFLLPANKRLLTENVKKERTMWK
jgi:hypothetical protein